MKKQLISIDVKANAKHVQPPFQKFWDLFLIEKKVVWSTTYYRMLVNSFSILYGELNLYFVKPNDLFRFIL